jgi:hypothetical protein
LGLQRSIGAGRSRATCQASSAAGDVAKEVEACKCEAFEEARETTTKHTTPHTSKHLPTLNMQRLRRQICITMADRLPPPANYTPTARDSSIYLKTAPGPAGAFDLITLSDHHHISEQHSDATDTWTDISTAVVSDICNLCFCIHCGQPSTVYDRFHFPYGPDMREDCASYWREYWRQVEKSRKRHHGWLKKCPQRPWVDERVWTGERCEGGSV